METKLDIRDFIKQFTREYIFLYKHRDNITEYREALSAFSDFIKTHGDFVREFERFRGYPITTEREAAAFMFALESMGAL